MGARVWDGVSRAACSLRALATVPVEGVDLPLPCWHFPAPLFCLCLHIYVSSHGLDTHMCRHDALPLPCSAGGCPEAPSSPGRWLSEELAQRHPRALSPMLKALVRLPVPSQVKPSGRDPWFARGFLMAPDHTENLTETQILAQKTQCMQQFCKQFQRTLRPDFVNPGVRALL